MIITPIKTRIMHPPQDDLFALIKESVKNLKEGDVLAITSKIVSIHQGRCQKIKDPDDINEKNELVLREADKYLPLEYTPNRKKFYLTMKYGLVISSAGIDTSNADGYFILWPHNPNKIAQEIYNFIKKEYDLREFGVVITDSHTTPLRLGVTGIGLSHYGFEGIKSYVGNEDLFGRKFKVERINIVDALSAAAVFVMGEGSEQTPMALVSKIKGIEFSDSGEPPTISSDEDIYNPLLHSDLWVETNKHNDE